MRFAGYPALSYGGAYGGYWNRAVGAVDTARAAGDPIDNSIVAATLGWIGRTFPEAPIRVMRETAKGEEVVPGHPLALALRRPNPFYSGSLMWHPLVMSWVLDGNAYLLKERTNGGDLLYLWYTPHWMLEPQWPRDGSRYISHYDYKVDGLTERKEIADVIHLRNGIDPRNTRKGLSQLKSALREIYTDNQITEYESWMLTNRGTPGAIISPGSADQVFTTEQAAFIKQDYVEKTTGTRRGEPIISLGSVKVDAPSFSPADMNLRDIRRTPEERISALIGVPAVVIGLGAGLERSTYNNTEQAYEAAYLSFLIPVQRMIAEELTTQLLPDFSDDPLERVAFDYTEVGALSEDKDELAKRAATLFQGSIIDRAKALGMMGEEATPKDKGVYFLMRGGTLVSGDLTDIGTAFAPAPAPGQGGNVPPATNGNGHAPTAAAALAALAKNGASP
jgi:HK97 family phage portal protein